MSKITALRPIVPATQIEPGTTPCFAERMAALGIGALLCFSLLVPGFHISDAVPNMRPEQLLLLAIVAIYGWLLLAGYARTIRWSGMFVVAAVYCICILLSDWYGAEFLGHSPVASDFYEIPKALLPLAFFTLGYEANLSERSLRSVLKFSSLAIFLVCVYAWAQRAHLGFTTSLDALYSSGEHVDVMLRTIGRVWSTMSNPNVLGELMTWSIVAFTMALVFRVGNRLWNALIVLSCLATLAMTESRYGVLTSVIGVALIFMLPSVSGSRRRIQILLLLLLLPVLAWAFVAVTNTNRYAAARLHSLKDPLQTDSLRERLDTTWPEAIGDFEKSPIFGNGSAKTYFDYAITDSEYLDVLKEFGMLGIVVYLGFFLYPLVLSWRGLHAARNADPGWEDLLPATFLTARLGVVMIVTALIMNVGESTFFNFQLQGFLWTWMGIGACSAGQISKASRIRLQLPSSNIVPFRSDPNVGAILGSQR